MEDIPRSLLVLVLQFLIAQHICEDGLRNSQVLSFLERQSPHAGFHLSNQQRLVGRGRAQENGDINWGELITPLLFCRILFLHCCCLWAKWTALDRGARITSQKQELTDSLQAKSRVKVWPKCQFSPHEVNKCVKIVLLNVHGAWSLLCILWYYYFNRLFLCVCVFLKYTHLVLKALSMWDEYPSGDCTTNSNPSCWCSMRQTSILFILTMSLPKRPGIIFSNLLLSWWVHVTWIIAYSHPLWSPASASGFEVRRMNQCSSVLKYCVFKQVDNLVIVSILASTGLALLLWPLI